MLRSGALVLAGAFLLAAPPAAHSQTLGHPQVSHQDLSFADVETNECTLRFSSGSVTPTDAFQTSMSTPVLLINGKTSEAFKTGDRVFLEVGSPVIVYRALVVQGGKNSATLAVSLQILKEVFYDGYFGFRITGSKNPTYGNFSTITVDEGGSDIRKMLPGFLECYEIRGI